MLDGAVQPVLRQRADHVAGDPLRRGRQAADRVRGI